MLRDPVCGMYVSRDTAIRRVFAGEEYYFCGERCADSFRK
ncbi:MAG: YHS domain-containing protein [Syntrophothermus sp.]